MLRKIRGRLTSADDRYWLTIQRLRHIFEPKLPEPFEDGRDLTLLRVGQQPCRLPWREFRRFAARFGRTNQKVVCVLEHACDPGFPLVDC
jgi:hypothetical protein